MRAASFLHGTSAPTLAAVALLAGVPGGVSASQVLAMDLRALTDDADAVVVADVISIRSAWTPDHRTILSTIEVSVGERWKGSRAPGHRLQIVQLGGSADGMEMRVHGMPLFAAGQRAVLFLRHHTTARGSTYAVVGMAQGMRRLFRSATDRRWMVDAPVLDAVVSRLKNGGVGPPPDVRAASLDELRASVGAIVNKGARP